MSNLSELYNQVSQFLNTDMSSYKKIQSNLISSVSDASVQAMSSDQGYCFKFALKSRNYKNLLQLVGLTERNLQIAFTKDWGSNSQKNHMHSDPYYQTYLFFLYFGIKENNQKIIESSLSCILFKLWNGRKTKFLQYCNKDIMNYVVNYMCSKKHLANRFNTPYDMIQNHFVPTLLTKYGDNIKKDPFSLKRIFEQAFTRVRQLFVSRTRIDIKTGNRVSEGGLFPLYKKAHDEGLSMSSVNIRGNEDNPISFSDYMTGSNMDELINSTVEKIVMNNQPTYSQMFVENLRKTYKLSKNVIQKLLIQLHDYKYHNKLHDIYSIILSQTEVIDKSDICNPKFTDLVNTKVLASKNSKSANELKSKLMNLLEDMLKQTVQRSISEYSNVHHIQLRKMIIRVLIYNLRVTVCK